MTTHKHARSPLLATLTLATMAFLAGSVITGAVAAHLALKKTRELASTADRSAARAKLLEGLLAQQTVEAIALTTDRRAVQAVDLTATDAMAQPAPQTQEDRPEPVQPEPAHPKEAPKDAIKSAKDSKDSPPPKSSASNKPSPAKAAQATVAQPPKAATQIAVTHPTAPAQSEQVKTNAPIPPDAVISARDKSKIEAVPAAALGIVKLTTDGVELKNGRTIPIGGTFPSGDRLLATDVENGQIVTDRRTILVL